tara:strand:- start:46 stop:246 length:201 start_codon:yes stop_codon:yes gene_type:complete
MLSELNKLMEKLFRPKGTLLALLMFLPITPSIAAITVFTKSVFINRNEDFNSISHHSKRVIHASRY